MPQAPSAASETGACDGEVACLQAARGSQDPSTGLLSLPIDLLHIIARSEGPHVRAACPTLRHAYGPLDLSLDLTNPSHFTSRFGTQAILENLFHCNPHITTLQLPPLDLYPTLPAVAAARFPSLQTLTWPTYRPPTNRTLAQLAPLHATLTALHMQPLSHPMITPSPAPRCPDPPTALATLTALCSLTLPCHLPPPHTAQLPAWLAPLAALPRLRALTLLPTHPRSAADDPLPHLAAATPHLTSLSIPAWALCGPASAALPPTAWPLLAHLHIHFQHPPPRSPGALAHCAAAIAALNARDPLCCSITATVHLASLEGVGDEADCLGWLGAAKALQVAELAVTFDEQALPDHAAAAACLWAWLRAQRSLRKLSVGGDAGQAPTCRQPADVPSPYLAIASLAACLEDLQLGLHWAAGYTQFVTADLGLLTRLTRLSISDAPTHRWEDGVDDFDRWGVEALTALRQLQVGNLPAAALPYATALPRLAALTIVDHQLPETVEESPFWDLSCLTNLAATLTQLTLQGLPRLQCRGLGVLRTLGALRQLRLTAVDCLAVQAARGLECLLPLPAGLRSLVVDEGVLRLTGSAQVQMLMEAAGPRCRVRVDHLLLDGREMSLDTKYGIGPVCLGPQWQVTRRPAKG